MSRRILFILLSIFLFLPLLFFASYAFAQTSFYTVSGYVCDDLNVNGICEPSELGIPGVLVYADNTYSPYKTYTNSYGQWTMNVPAGTHSIEIANAGSGGSRPTTSEKFVVSGNNTNVQFGIQSGGYAVEGYVRDPYGRPVAGATVYVDNRGRQTAVTNSSGYYRIDNVGYDSSPAVYGYSGGHNLYVQGYENNPVLVNPQSAQTSMPANFTIATSQPPVYPPSCGVGGYARNPYTGECRYFSDSCQIPANWQPVSSCTQYPPPPVNPPAYNPSCTVYANPQSGNVPFSTTITATFNNGGNSSLYPTFYDFNIAGRGHSSQTSNSQHSFQWSFDTTGTQSIYLKIRHSGGEVSCNTSVYVQGNPQLPYPYDPGSTESFNNAQLTGQEQQNFGSLENQAPVYQAPAYSLEQPQPYYPEPVNQINYDYNMPSDQTWNYQDPYYQQPYDSYNSYDSGAYDWGSMEPTYNQYDGYSNTYNDYQYFDSVQY